MWLMEGDQSKVDAGSTCQTEANKEEPVPPISIRRLEEKYFVEVDLTLLSSRLETPDPYKRKENDRFNTKQFGNTPSTSTEPGML